MAHADIDAGDENIGQEIADILTNATRESLHCGRTIVQQVHGVLCRIEPIREGFRPSGLVEYTRNYDSTREGWLIANIEDVVVNDFKVVPLMFIPDEQMGARNQQGRTWAEELDILFDGKQYVPVSPDMTRRLVEFVAHYFTPGPYLHSPIVPGLDFRG